MAEAQRSDGVAQLERQLEAVKAERDDLQRDVEQLCMSRGSSMFSSSYVISEKMLGMEKEIKGLRTQLRSVTAGRDDAVENIQLLRAAKRQSDVGWQAERERCAGFERELAFYQSSSAKAMSDRDRANFEADELRQQVAFLESSLRSAEGRAGSERFQKEELAKQLSETRQQLGATTAELRARIKECGVLPELRASLARTQGALQELSAAHTGLQDKLKSTEQVLEQAQANLQQQQQEAAGLKEQLSGERAAASKAQEAAAAQAARLREQNAALQKQANEQGARIREDASMLEQTSAALITAQAGVKELQASKQSALELLRQEAATKTAGLEAEVAALQDQLFQAEASLSHTIIERDAAQQALEQTRATAAEDADAVESLTQRNNELKVRLAAATQEKVEALLKAASGAADGRHHSSRPSSATASPLVEDGLRSSSGEHEWDAPRRAHSDELDAGDRCQALEQQVVQLEERLANIGRLLPLAHRYRAALQALSPRLTGAAPAGGKAGAKGAQDAQAELNRLGEECKLLRQKLGLGGAAAEQEDLALCEQQLPPSAATLPAEAILKADAAAAPKPGTAAPAKKGAVAAVFAAVHAVTARADIARADADKGGSDVDPKVPTAQGMLGKPHGNKAAATEVVLVKAQGEKSLNALPGRLDRALAREVMELVTFGIGSLRHVNKVMAYNSLMDF